METAQLTYRERAYLEYHGSTIVERIIVAEGAMPVRDWLLFDTVEEAADFYNENRIEVGNA